MAVIKGNRFSHDDDDTRQARLALISENIDTYAPIINVTGVHLTWAQGAFDVFVDYRATAAREDGDIDEATQEYRIKYNAAHNYYVRAKALLKAVLESYQDNDEAAEKYGTMRKTPRNVDALYAKIVQWKDQHDIYIAEGDPRVIADAIVTEMMTQGADFYVGWKFAITQKREAAEAYDIKQAEFLLGSKYLKLIYQLAVMVWGDEDPRLIELGFQTKSGIWTEGNGGVSPEIGIPQNIAAEIIGEDVKISWDEVEDVDSYQLVHTEHLPLFLGLYDGEDTEYLHINPPGGTHNYKVRAKKGDMFGEYSEWVTVEVEWVVPNPPTALELEYEAADERIKAVFQAPANSPDGFNAYVAIVQIGDPPPDKPVEAYYEDLFTLTFFISPLQLGMTYYVWVTSVDDGEESEPCGPEAIDIA